MPNSPASSFPLPPDTCEVHAHDHVMRYRRSGAGRAVLMLRSGSAPEPLWPELPDALAARFRLIVPELSAGDGEVVAWIADFLEGLGIESVAIVAADGFCAPAVELTLLGDDRVTRLVLVPDDAAGAVGLDGALATTAREEPVPLLVVRRGLPAAEALPLVTGFLDGDGTAPSGAMMS
ncbi:MAG TPA: hypothetical protein VFY16_03325 [Gemmatimonadaceae bacterium]|nr:hypothetical protein [Gemmatimonadaceae bacterium]